jgi:hypothetical protein
MSTSSLYGILAIASFALVLVFATVAFLFTWRMRSRPMTDSGSGVGSVPAVLRKLRTREPLSDDELALARQVLSVRGHAMAYALPATLFCLGSFYVFGSLEQLHGHQASERTFLGVIPMITSTNLAIQLTRSVFLKRRLTKSNLPKSSAAPHHARDA